MKTKSILLLLTAGLVFTGCPKDKNVPPTADTEMESALDVCWAAYAITDIEMMCGFLGINELDNHFYRHTENTPPLNWSDGTRDVADRRISLNFHETPGVDGRLRRGEVRLDYAPDVDHQNNEYYHQYRFSGDLTLPGYRVDDWVITLDRPALLKNNLTTNQWDPRVTKLEWSLEGNFKFTHANDPARNMTWEGKLTKILLNTSDTRVFHPTLQPVITWSLATVGYHGSASGLVNGDQPYKMSIDKSTMLVRDLTCSPSLLGVSQEDSDLQPVKEEHHPFVKGIATFELQGKYPRRVYFGNEANSSLAAQCDNTGQILIKGILYPVNFYK